MFVRAAALSLALLIGGAAIIPLATDTTEAGPRKTRKKYRNKKYKKYSKGWWRQYHAKKSRAQAIRARKRAMRLKQLRLERAAQAGATAQPVQEIKVQSQNVLPTGDSAPKGWKASSVSPAELQFRVDGSAGDQIGSAAISVVGPANSTASFPNGKSIGGVSTSALRRDVIDKMIRDNGWVVNDYQQSISGQPVYVVVGQSQAKNGSVVSRMFYFTEVDGKIYSVATNSPVQEQERLAEESEKVINSLRARVRPGVRAALKEEE